MASNHKKRPSTPSVQQEAAAEAGRAELTHKARASRLALGTLRSALLGYTTSDRDLMLAGKLFPGSEGVASRLLAGEPRDLIPHSRLAEFQCSLAEREAALALRDLAQVLDLTSHTSIRDVQGEAAVRQVLELLRYPSSDWAKVEGAGEGGRMAVRYDARLPALLEKALHALEPIESTASPQRESGGSLATEENAGAQGLGSRPELLTGRVPASVVLRGVFRQEGEGWRVGIGEEGIVLARDDDGLHYLAALLAKPNEAIAAGVLYRVRPRADRPARGVQYEEALAEGVKLDADQAQEVMDREGAHAAWQEIQSLSDEIDQAQKNSDEAALERLEGERDVILEQLKRDTGLGGRLRTFSGDQAKAGKAIGNAIKRVLGRLKRHAPALWMHLETSIQGRSTTAPMYQPVQQIDWVLGSGPKKDGELRDV